MNTDRKVLSSEQKERKNELARALRAKKRFEKQVMGDPVIDEQVMEVNEVMGGSSPSAEIDDQVTEVTEVTEVT